MLHDCQTKSFADSSPTIMEPTKEMEQNKNDSSVTKHEEVWKEIYDSFTDRWKERFKSIPQLPADLKSGALQEALKNKYLEIKETIETRPYPVAAYVITFSVLYGRLLWVMRGARLEEARIKRTFQEVKDRQARERVLQQLREEKLGKLSAEEVEQIRKKKIEEEIRREKEQLANISRK